MPSLFTRTLAARNPSPSGRRWFYLPYDQLTLAIGPASRLSPAEVGVVLVEAPAKTALRPYHRQKLALVLANQRQFALELAARGVAVRYAVAPEGYASALEPLAAELGSLTLMAPAERELATDLAPLVAAGALSLVPHEGWLTSPEDFLRGAGPSPPWRMDGFYREVRRRTGILMERGKPVGGRFSYDGENRLPWKGEPPAPSPPRFVPDAITQEVGELVASRFASHPGTLDLNALPTTAADAEALWSWAQRAALPHFGPFEDAMSTRSSGLFHTRVSSHVNLHRLLPQRIVADVLALDLPLPSREGFVRQVLGWREFVRHVHRETDGFRNLSSVPAEPGRDGALGAPSFLGAARALPAAYWGSPSGLACLDHVVADVWREGWSHHITRLMVLSNLATLLDVSPRELTDWFWVAYTDAFDWVVEPNVLGMGTFGAGETMTTKPYVSGAAYLDRMSDYCAGCRLDPKTTCPVTDLYWAFLARHRECLAGNQRLTMPLASLGKRTEPRRRADARVFEHVSTELAASRSVTPLGVERARRGG